MSAYPHLSHLHLSVCLSVRLLNPRDQTVENWNERKTDFVWLRQRRVNYPNITIVISILVLLVLFEKLLAHYFNKRWFYRCLIWRHQIFCFSFEDFLCWYRKHCQKSFIKLLRKKNRFSFIFTDFLSDILTSFKQIKTLNFNEGRRRFEELN